jgi:hypothetical protein
MPPKRGATHPPYELFVDEVWRICLLLGWVNGVSTDARDLTHWHDGRGGKRRDPPNLQAGERRAHAPLRGPGELNRPGHKERQAHHRAHRPRRRDRREAWIEVGAGLLDGRNLRHGHRIRGTGRGSHKRPPPGDRLFGQRANHHASSVRRGRDVGVTKEARLSRSSSEKAFHALG